MKQEIDKISYREYLFLVFNHIIGYTLVLSFTDSVAKQDLAGHPVRVSDGDSFCPPLCGAGKTVPFQTLLEVYRLVSENGSEPPSPFCTSCFFLLCWLLSA
jgi:hypothetical protein